MSTYIPHAVPRWKPWGLVLAVVLVPSAGWSEPVTDLLRCHSKAGVTFEDDGTIGEGAWNKDILRSFIVDISTGIVRLPNATTGPWHLEIIQQGTDENDAVLVVPSVKGVAPPSVLRVRQWKTQSAITFSVYDVSTVVTGTCEPVQ